MFKISMVVSVCLILASCIKTQQACEPLKPSSEASQIQSFAASNSIITATDPSGIYYQIIDSGTGIKPSLTSKIFITYSGTFLDGTVFDQQTDPSQTGWVLSSLIQGWQIGIPLISKGGHIKLIIPSSLCYGCIGQTDSYGKVIIPANSILYFDITLFDVQ